MKWTQHVVVEQYTAQALRNVSRLQRMMPTNQSLVRDAKLIFEARQQQLSVIGI